MRGWAWAGWRRSGSRCRSDQAGGAALHLAAAAVHVKEFGVHQPHSLPVNLLGRLGHLAVQLQLQLALTLMPLLDVFRDTES